MIATVVVMACLGLFFDRTFGPKQEFATYRDEITVVGSEYGCRISGSNLYVTVVGTLTNASKVGWKEIGVEAQFMDKAGKLIDVIPASADGFRDVVLLPHGIAAFKIEGRAARAESDYGKYTVSVRWAKDVDAMFLKAEQRKERVMAIGILIAAILLILAAMSLLVLPLLMWVAILAFGLFCLPFSGSGC